MKKETVESLQTTARDLSDKICLEQVGAESNDLRQWLTFANSNLLKVIEQLDLAKKYAEKDEAPAHDHAN